MTQGTVRDLKDKSLQLNSEVSRISNSPLFIHSNLDEPDGRNQEQSSHVQDLERILCDIDSQQQEKCCDRNNKKTWTLNGNVSKYVILKIDWCFYTIYKACQMATQSCSMSMVLLIKLRLHPTSQFTTAVDAQHTCAVWVWVGACPDPIFQAAWLNNAWQAGQQFLSDNFLRAGC